MAQTLEEAIYQVRWVDGIKKDSALVSDAGIADAVRGFVLAETERLRKIEDGLKNLVAMRRQVLDNIRADAEYHEAVGMPRSAEFDRASAEKLEGEIWPLEALLNG